MFGDTRCNELKLILQKEFKEGKVVYQITTLNRINKERLFDLVDEALIPILHHQGSTTDFHIDRPRGQGTVCY